LANLTGVPERRLTLLEARYVALDRAEVPLWIID
jgi:hypothetical protein